MMRQVSRSLAATLTIVSFIVGVPIVSALAQDKPTAPTQKPMEPPPGEDIRVDELLPANGKKSAKALSPLDLVMKDGIPALAKNRAMLREDLYALLATAVTAKEAKKIASQIERVWLTTGSDTVSVLMMRANRALKVKDKKLALKLLDSVVVLSPDSAEAWNRRAYVHYASKNYPAAVGDLRRALALDKNHFKALDGLASIFRQLGDDTKAFQVYKQLREIHPHWPGLEKAYQELKGKVQGRGI
jgi:tetratricopeptide (TPR) repeat protein